MTVADPVATPLAVALLEALINAYEDPSWELEPPCTMGLISGAMVIADYCCADIRSDGTPCLGQLTVRVVDCYPTEVFPQPRTTAMPVCGSSWAVHLELAVLRCAPLVDSDARPVLLPSMEEEMAVAERALADMGLLRHVVTDFAYARDNSAFVLGQYTPMGPEGGCVGGSIGATFLVE